MEIYMDLDETLWSVDRYLNPKTKQNLAKIAKCHTVVILSNGPLCEMDELKAYPLVLVSTLENRLYHQGNLEEFPLDGLFLHHLFHTYQDFIYTAYSIKDGQCDVFCYKERLKTFYPGRSLRLVSDFTDSSCLWMAVSKSVLKKITKDICDHGCFVLNVAEDKNRALLKISVFDSSKEAWLLRLKKDPLIGIGNDLNDFLFMRHCKVKVAMQNATATLKEKCDAVTEKNAPEGGAVDFIQDFLTHRPSSTNNGH